MEAQQLLGVYLYRRRSAQTAERSLKAHSKADHLQYHGWKINHEHVFACRTIR